MSTTNILDLNNRIDALEMAVSGGDSAQANKKDIATEFNTTTNYTAGEFVYYKGKLYQFNADHAAGAWDPTDVVESNVTDQIVSNKAAIDAVDDRVDGVIASMTRGYHTANGADTATKLVTLTDGFQQLLVSLLISGTRSVYLVSQYATGSAGTVAENIFTTPNATPIDIAATKIDASHFTISLPPYAQLNIMSTEAFTVSNYTP